MSLVVSIWNKTFYTDPYFHLPSTGSKLTSGVSRATRSWERGWARWWAGASPSPRWTSRWRGSGRPGSRSWRWGPWAPRSVWTGTTTSSMSTWPGSSGEPCCVPFFPHQLTSGLASTCVQVGSEARTAARWYLLLQGVPYHWIHFVFVIFSGSRAHTEELFIAIG